MSTNTDRATAKIYQFPLRGRFAPETRDDIKSSVMPRGTRIVVGGAWYHDEAIKDDRASRN